MAKWPWHGPPVGFAMKMLSRLSRLAATVLAIWPAAASVPDPQGEVPYDFFYAPLAESGTWIESVNYGYVWQPTIATETIDWRPYADGYWSDTDQGWTWISYEDFGWATYHYGRWARLADLGWIWVPGFQWAPAWVSWRASPGLTGRGSPRAPRPAPDAVAVDAEEVVGWAPLPPEAAFHFSRGLSPKVDLECGIGPDFYNFVPARYFGETVLQPWIYRSAGNAALIRSTSNCTNIIYRPRPGFIWSGGPSYGALRPLTQKPIAQFKLEARFVTSLSRIGASPPNRVELDHYLVTAPIVAPPAGLAPGSVGLPPAATPEKPPLAGAVVPEKPVDHGWAGAPGDAESSAALREQIQQQAEAAPSLPAAPAEPVVAADVIRIAAPAAGDAKPAAKSGASRRRVNRSPANDRAPSPAPSAGALRAKAPAPAGLRPRAAPGNPAAEPGDKPAP